MSIIHKTENPQEAKSVCPGKPVWHAKAYPGRDFTQRHENEAVRF